MSYQGTGTGLPATIYSRSNEVNAMLNIFMHGLATFIDLTALSSVVGTVLCLFWTMCPACDDSSICANTCFDRCRRLLFFCLIGLSMSSIGMLVQRTMEMAGLGITEITPL